jgi:hypothetical protein
MSGFEDMLSLSRKMKITFASSRMLGCVWLALEQTLNRALSCPESV